MEGNKKRVRTLNLVYILQQGHERITEAADQGSKRKSLSISVSAL